MSETKNQSKRKQESTMLQDKMNKEIFEGDIVKIPCEDYADFHGSFTLHEVIQVNGQWVTSYLASEAGRKLPRGYVRGFLLDNFEYDPKLFFWSEDYKPRTEIEVVGNAHQDKHLYSDKPDQD
ncbi:putative phage protein (TIGR01671 family) [Rossellomorea marisflavi]